MQAVQQVAGSSWWPQLLTSGFVVTAIGFLVRWVVAPASRAYVRDDLQPEIAKIDQHEARIAAAEGRLEAQGAELDALKGVPVGIARIEERIEALHTIISRRSTP